VAGARCPAATLRRGEYLLSETPTPGSREEAVLEGAGEDPCAGQKAVWVVPDGRCGGPLTPYLDVL
jgi:hypothetical protein